MAVMFRIARKGKHLEQVIGSYRLVREVGRGATATVYLAEHTETNERFALKVIKLNDDSSKLARRFRKLFQAEATVAGRLDHPNITKIYDWKIEQDRAYLAMEFVEGESLEKYTAIDKLMPMNRTVSIAFKCALALDYAHRQGVVHRDIKPANIMIGPEPGDDVTVKITDYGLALNTNKQIDVDSTFINGLGSPAYMSPEQIKGYQLNGQTDLYSLGVMFYQLLTGRLPFRAKTTAALMYKIINTDSAPVSQLSTTVPKETDNILKKCLEKDLFSRYRNGAKLAQDLSVIRYQLLNDKYVPPDDSKWKILRGIFIFNEFDDTEVWELLRISSFRAVDTDTALFQQGEGLTSFGVLLEGVAEIVRNNKVIATIEPGALVGEMTYLDPEQATASASVVARSAVKYLDVSIPALAFATEELKEKLDKLLTVTVVRRLRAANYRLERISADATPAKPPVVESARIAGLELVPEGHEVALGGASGTFAKFGGASGTVAKRESAAVSASDTDEALRRAEATPGSLPARLATTGGSVDGAAGKTTREQAMARAVTKMAAASAATGTMAAVAAAAAARTGALAAARLPTSLNAAVERPSAATPLLQEFSALPSGVIVGPAPVAQAAGASGSSTADMAAKLMSTTEMVGRLASTSDMSDGTLSDSSDSLDSPISPAMLSTTEMAGKFAGTGDLVQSMMSDELLPEMLSTMDMVSKFSETGSAQDGVVVDGDADLHMLDELDGDLGKTVQMPGGFKKSAQHAEPDRYAGGALIPDLFPAISAPSRGAPGFGADDSDTTEQLARKLHFSPATVTAPAPTSRFALADEPTEDLSQPRVHAGGDDDEMPAELLSTTAMVRKMSPSNLDSDEADGLDADDPMFDLQKTTIMAGGFQSVPSTEDDPTEPLMPMMEDIVPATSRAR